MEHYINRFTHHIILMCLGLNLPSSSITYNTNVFGFNVSLTHLSWHLFIIKSIFNFLGLIKIDYYFGGITLEIMCYVKFLKSNINNFILPHKNTRMLKYFSFICTPSDLYVIIFVYPNFILVL